MTPESKTSKTEFMRWLDANPDHNDPRFDAIRTHRRKWGAYLRWKYPVEFNMNYDCFWLKHPELWGKVYDDNEGYDLI